MNATIPLSLQIHDAIRTARHILTALSLIAAIPTLTVIMLCANRVSKRYAVLLGLIVIEVNLIVCLLLILDPLMLLPDTCMMRHNPVIPLPGDANLYFELWVGVTTMNVPLFFACFLERHQAVQSPMSRWLLSSSVRHGVLFLIVCALIALTLILRVSEMPADAERALLQRLANRWSVAVLGGSCFDYSLFMLFSAMGVVGLCAGTLVTALMSWHTLHTLRQASTLSETMKNFNTSMTKVLIVQAIFPIILILCPLLFSLIAVIIRMEGPLPFSACYLCMTLYALVHSIVQMTVSPMHRKRLRRFLRREKGQRTVSTGGRMFMSTSN